MIKCFICNNTSIELFEIYHILSGRYIFCLKCFIDQCNLKGIANPRLIVDAFRERKKVGSYVYALGHLLNYKITYV